MSTSRNRRRLLAAALAGSTAAAGLTWAGGAPALAAPAAQPGLHQRFEHTGLSKPALLSKAEAAAKLAATLPASGQHAFLLKVGTAATGTRFAAVRRTGTLAAAKVAATDQLDVVRAAQNRVVDQLGSLAGRTTVLFRTHAAMDAIAVTTDVKNAAALYHLPGVTAVYPVTPKTPDNSYAVPFQNGPVAWDGDGTGHFLGQGVVVADIDTGLDYTHADFGGPGTPAAYDAAYASDTVAPAAGSYDPQKYLAGLSYDLAGDAYQPDPDSADYSPTPAPDPNPLDCSPAHGGEGHGSHTAGTIAGYGVSADGSTYTGEYSSQTDVGSMQIGPGMAPKAELISYRVFGCTGSTDLISAAIDRAMDPNGDGDTSDHADVVNLSLGSDFGAPDDGDAAMADAAVDAGATLSISMGNSSDVYDIGGSPGAATKAITVAASADAQEIDDTVALHITGGSNASLDGDAKVAGTRATMYAWGQPGEQYGGGDMPADAPLVDVASVDSSDADACNPVNDPTGRLKGAIAVVPQWNDTTPECGSIARGATLRAAGAVGFLFLSDRNSVSAGINGDQGDDTATDDGTQSTDAIPGALVVKGSTSGTPTDAALIRAALAAGATVTVTGTSAATSSHVDPTLNDTMADFSSRGQRGEGDLKPDVAAVGATVFSVLPGSGGKGQSMSGTSMAAPMVSGLAALVKSEHPAWTPLQIKSDIMNTADHDISTADANPATYAPMRVGAGRIDAGTATKNTVLASVVEDPGAVSAGFGPVEVTGTAVATRTKTISLQNTGTTPQTYAAAVADTTTVPGVTYTVSPSSVTIPAGGTATVTLTLSIDPTLWDKTFDPTKGDTDPADSGLPQQTLAEASGRVIFTPADTSAPDLRVPYYSAPRLASTMTQPSSLDLAADGTGTLPLTGTGVNTPSVFSFAQGFELTARSGTAPACSALVTTDCLTNESDKSADIKYVGLGMDDGSANDNGVPTLDVAIVTHGAHTTAGDRTLFVVYTDVDSDGVPDTFTINTHYDASDVIVAETFSARTGESLDTEVINGFLGELDTAEYDSDVMIVPIGLGVFGDTAAIHYGIEALGVQRTDVDMVGLDTSNGGLEPTLVANLAAPGLSVTQDGFAQAIDLPPAVAGGDTAVTVKRDIASYREEGGQGLLMVHFHNKVGDKAQVVSLPVPSVRLAASTRSIVRGASTTLTATVQHPTAGNVVFRDASGTKLGIGEVVNGKARLTVTPKTPGVFRATATYAPGTPFEVASAAVAVTVTKARAALTITAPRQVRTGARITVKVKVATVNRIAPTGSIRLKYGTRTVKAVLRSGVATFKVRMPGTPRKLALRATYLGSTSYLRGTRSASVRIHR